MTSSPDVNILLWNIDTVADWIKKLNLEIYSPAFIENKISGDVLVYLDHSDLVDIGVKSVGHRLIILKAIYQLIIDNDIKLDNNYYIPPTILEQQSVSSKGLSIDSGNDSIIQSFEVRDERMSYAEAEIKRLMDGYIRLREDLLPIFRIVKESEPLPTPDTVPLTSPGPTSAPAIQQQLHHHNNQSSPTLMSYANSPTPTSPPPFITTFPDRGPLSASSTLSTQASSASLHQQANGNNNTITSSSSSIKKKGLSPSISGTITTTNKSPTSDWYDDRSSQAQLSQSNSISRGNRKTSLNGMNSTTNSAASTPITGNSSSSLNTPSSSSTEPFKSFRVSMDDPCYKVLPVALRKYKINGDPRQYALLVCYGDQERLLGLEEKPLIIFKELQDAGKRPVFMLRHIEGSHSGSQAGVVVSGTPGGVL